MNDLWSTLLWRYYFAPYLKYGSKILLSNGLLLTFFNSMFANCVHTKMMFIHVSDREIYFSQNCSKFAVKCNWNSKKSQNVQTLVFWKKKCFFRKKMLKIFKITACGKFFLKSVSKGIVLKNVFPPYFWGFFGKNQKKLKLEKLENMMKKQSILKKKILSSF